MEKRVFLIVLDSFGIGAEPDAAAFGDEGTNTLGAIAKHPNFNCPNLQKMGMFNIDGVTAGEKTAAPIGSFARLQGQSMGIRLIVKNPTVGTTIPKNNYPPKQILNDEQLERFMQRIRQDERWYDFFYTELTTGLRRGEICGLKWEDFDAENGKLKVRRSVAKRKGGGLNIGETKTETGTRTIILPPSTAELLRKRKETAVSEWIFPNIYEPEKPMHPDYAYHRLKTLLKQAELPLIRFHDLRHTFAPHALTSGVDAKTLSGILGHTNASFTLDTYTHVTSDMQKTVLQEMNLILPMHLIFQKETRT